MAERNYTITIKYKDVKSSRSPIAGDNAESDTNKGKGLLSKEDAKVFGKAMVAYGVVKSYATQIVNHEVSMVELRTGSKELQERANFANQVGQQAVSIVETTATSAMVGGWVGAIVGFVMSLGHTVLGYVQNQNRIDTAKSIENRSIQFNYIRAGANGSRSGQ